MPVEKPQKKSLRGWIVALTPFLFLAAIAYRPLLGLPRALAIQRAVQALNDGRLVEAETRLDALVRENPKDLSLRLRWVVALRRLGRITDAETVLQRAIELGLPARDGRREHALLQARSDFPRAEESLRRLLGANPGDEEIRSVIEQNQVEQRSATRIRSN